MDEQKEEAKEEEKPVENSDKGNIPEPNDKIDRANAAAQRMEEATEKAKTENDRREALAVEKTLGGTAEAGKPSEETKEETPKEYKDRVMSGKL